MGTDFILEAAATDRRYKIVYGDQPRPKDFPVWLELGGDNEDEEEKEEEKEEDPRQTYRSTSMSISQSLLNLAYSLGLISSQEHAALSHQLGQTGPAWSSTLMRKIICGT